MYLNKDQTKGNQTFQIDEVAQSLNAVS